MFYPKEPQIFLSKRRQFNQECFEGTAAITGSEDRKQFPRLCRKLDNFSDASKSYWCQHLGDMISYSLIFLSVWQFCCNFLLLKLFFQYQRRAMQPDVLDNHRAVQIQISAVQIQVITFFCSDTCQGFLPAVALLLKGKVRF